MHTLSSGFAVTGAQASADADALAELRALNAHFVHNYVTNNVSAHDALLHPMFLCIGPQGERVDRATYLRRWATAFNPERIPYWDTRDERITRVGETALLRATNKHIVRRDDGVEVTGMTTYTDVYVKVDGRWRCIEAHMTPVAPAHQPPDSTIISVYIKGVLQPRP